MEFPALKQSPLFSAMSSVGQAIFQPNGIFYWSKRAKKEADLKGTIGTAIGLERDIIGDKNTRSDEEDHEITCFLPQLQEYITLSSEEYVPYAPMTGIRRFRELWKDWIVYKGQNESNFPSGSINIKDQITPPIICNGITNAIFLMTRLFLNTGESILAPEKRWGNYDSIIVQQNQSRITSFKLFENANLNFQDLKRKAEIMAKEQNKIVMILNFPNNPTGFCPSTEDIREIKKILFNLAESIQVPIIIFCDDAYEGFVYESHLVSASIFYEIVGMHPLIIPLKLDGSSKEMLMYGSRIAAITLGLHEKWFSEDQTKMNLVNEWENKMEAMIRSTISNCNRFAQEVLIKLMEKGPEFLLEQRSPTFCLLQKRYQKAIEAFQKFQTPHLSLDPAGGGFFIFINVEGIDAEHLADILLKQYKLGTIPMKKPQQNLNGLRIAYCSIPEDKIEEVFQRLDQAIREISS